MFNGDLMNHVGGRTNRSRDLTIKHCDSTRYKHGFKSLNVGIRPSTMGI